MTLAAGVWQTWPQPRAHVTLLPNVAVQMIAADEHSGRTFVLGSTQPTARTGALEVVSALDSRSGTVLRTMRTTLGGGGARCCAMWALVDSPAGTVAVGGQGGDAAYLLDERDGTLLGTAHGSSGLVLLPGDPAGHVLSVVASRAFNGVRVLDGRSGRTVRSIPCSASLATGFQFWVAPVLLDGPRRRLAILAAQQHPFRPGVCLIDLLHDRAQFMALTNGSTFAVIDAFALDDRTGHLFVATDGATGGETPAVLSMLDVRTGQILRQIAIGAYPARILVTSSRVVVACGDYPDPGELDVLDTASGRLLHRRANRKSVATLTQDPSRGDVVVTYSDGGGDHLDPRTGQVRARIPTASVTSTLLAADPVSHRRYVLRVNQGGVERGGVAVVQDTRTGAVVDTILLGQLSGASVPMAIDTRLHRGFVLATCPRAEQAAAWLPEWLRDRLPGRTRTVPIPASTSCIRMLDTGN